MRAVPSPDLPAARPARRSAVERLAADRAKYVRGLAGSGKGPASAGGCPGGPGGPHSDAAPPACGPAPVARRAVARKPLRPDSLVIYRQKCEFARGPGPDGSRGGLVRKLFPGPSKDKAPGPPETVRLDNEAKATLDPAAPHPAPAVAPAPPASARGPRSAAPPEAPAGPELRAARRAGLQRSQSDLSARSPAARAESESDTFFRYCGLEPEVVEALGRENFSAKSDSVALKARSVSMATSDSGLSRHSEAEDGLQEEELGQVPSAPSVVERNARIIKWLYTCRKAAGTPGQRLQGPA